LPSTRWRGTTGPRPSRRGVGTKKDFLPKVIDYWKVIMTTTNGEEVELEDIPEDVCAEIDEIIASRYDVSWVASGREEEEVIA
jgi:hypothetical protein